jgi:hypothetical protein
LCPQQVHQRNPDRLPLADFYAIDTGKHRACQARSVVKGIFIKMLADRAARKSGLDKPVPHSTRHQRNLDFCSNGVPGLA